MKKARLLLTTVAMAAAMSFTAFAGEWKQDATGYWYQNDDGSFPTNSWQEISGKQYYFGADGYMLANTTTPDGKQVGADGALVQAPLFDFDGANARATYVKHEVSTDYDGNPCLILYYNYTNKRQETKSAMWGDCYIKAFQNGIECDYTFMNYDNKTGKTERDNMDKEIMSGVTITVADVFKLTDMSDVTLDISDMWDWDNKTSTTAVLKLQ